MLGPGAISRDFALGLRVSQHGVLHAVGSSSPERASTFAAEHGARFAGAYDDILAREDVDAVYIGTVHTTHAELAIRSLQAGKAVLCEKPASPTVAEVDRVLAVAGRAKRPFLEAYKTRFGPFADALRDLVTGGALGAPLGVEAAFGFDAETREGRLFDRDLAGGAILDVGCYPVALAVQLAASAGEPIDSPLVRSVAAELIDGVDGASSAQVMLGGLTADVRTSIVGQLPRSGIVRFTDGEVVLPDLWGDRTLSATTLIVRQGGRESRMEVPPVQPMGAEADAVSLAIAEGRVEVPEMPWSHTRAVARVLTDWRAAALAA